MPRNVRNFWVEVEIDGYKHMLKGGPRNKNGGFNLKVYQRDLKEVKFALRVHGHQYFDKGLALEVHDSQGKLLHQLRTEQ